MMVFAGRASARGMGRAISGALSGGIILASLVAFGWVASGALKATDILSHARWTPFVAAVILQFSMMIFFMLLWERLLFILWGNRSGIAVKAVRPGLYVAYSRSWLARYIPGHFWTLGGRILLASKVGVPAEAVARSMVFEVVFFRSLVVIIGLALILAASVQLLAGLAVLIFGLLGFAASIPLAQRVLAPEDKSSSKESPWNKVQQRARRILVGPIPFSIKSTIWAVFVYGIYASLQLVFIVLIAESFAELTLTQAFIIAGAWGLSITLGWFSFLPAGFGVRDGLAFVMFSQMLDAPAVSLTVAASRVVTTVMDLVFVGAVELLARVMTARQPRVPDTGVADHASDYAIPDDD